MIDMTEEQAREVQEDDRSIVKMEDFTSPDELYQELVQRVTKHLHDRKSRPGGKKGP